MKIFPGGAEATSANSTGSALQMAKRVNKAAAMERRPGSVVAEIVFGHVACEKIGALQELKPNHLKQEGTGYALCPSLKLITGGTCVCKGSAATRRSKRFGFL